MIHILPRDVVNKIAAGEVVDRPVSIVKELVENALDAGSTRIEISLEEGGIRLIRVKDNGIGMSAQDAELCLLRHATSKIQTIDDLFKLSSFGFRGEALAAIASVSQFELITKNPGDISGTCVTVSRDQMPVTKPVAAQEGTTVMVENLFFQIPARKKFLKSPVTEYRHILRYLQQVGLMHPDVELKFLHQKKEVFHWTPSSFPNRVRLIFGKSFFDQMISAECQESSIRISGFLAKPSYIHSTHKNQFLFVNQRPVYDALIARSVLEAYETLIPRGYFPAFILKIFVDPKLVDVNVHPRKSEVKFADVKNILLAVKGLTRSQLKSHDLAPKAFFSKPAGFYSSSSPPFGSSFGFVKTMPQRSMASFTPDKPSFLQEQGWIVLGQIHRSFLLVETHEGLQVFDQHAVSEIVNFQKLKKESGSLSGQHLLLPITIELSHEELELVKEHETLLAKFGWITGELSPKSIQLEAIPSILKIENIEPTFKDLIHELSLEQASDMSKKELQMMKFEACRGAVMFGDMLSIHEIQSLLNQWLLVENNAACEHGRPAAAKIPLEEMKKYFKR